MPRNSLLPWPTYKPYTTLGRPLTPIESLSRSRALASLAIVTVRQLPRHAAGMQLRPTSPLGRGHPMLRFAIRTLTKKVVCTLEGKKGSWEAVTATPRLIVAATAHSGSVALRQHEVRRRYPRDLGTAGRVTISDHGTPRYHGMPYWPAAGHGVSYPHVRRAHTRPGSEHARRPRARAVRMHGAYVCMLSQKSGWFNHSVETHTSTH